MLATHRPPGIDADAQCPVIRVEVPHGARLRNSSGLCTRQHGYVLVFTLSVLFFLSVLVLGLATALRVDAQLIAKEKSLLQTEFVALGAIDYLMAQWVVTGIKEGQAGGSGGAGAQRERDPSLWRPEGGAYKLTLDEVSVRIHIEDAGWRPDINLLSESEWQRLFMVLDVPVGQARELAQRTLETRSFQAALGGVGGFSSLQDLLQVPGLAADLVFGVPQDPKRLAIKDLVTVGTGLKRIEINRSPLALFEVILGVRSDALKKLAELRQERLLNIEEVAALLGVDRSIIYAGTVGAWIVKVMPENQSSGPMHWALVKQANSGYAVMRRGRSPVSY